MMREDRRGTAPVGLDEYRKLVEAETEARIILNAIRMDVPVKHIRDIFLGGMDELTAYRETGLAPEQITEMDRLYLEKCIELGTVAAERDEIAAERDRLARMLEGRSDEDV